jgi:uncharacterized protein (DUF2164 family)
LDFESYLADNITLLEDGLEFLKTEDSGNSGRIDISCVDIYNNLTIIELKINKDQDDALIQALHYSKERNDVIEEGIDKLISEFDYPENTKFNEELYPRIILVAPKFSKRLIEVSTYLSEETELEVDLFEYETLTEGKKDYFVLNPVVYNKGNKSIQTSIDNLKNKKLIELYTHIQKTLIFRFPCNVKVDTEGGINFQSKRNIWYVYFELFDEKIRMVIRKSKEQNHTDVYVKSYTDFENNLEIIEKSYLMTKSW